MSSDRVHAADVLADDIDEAVAVNGVKEIDVDPVRAAILVTALNKIEADDGHLSPDLTALRDACQQHLEESGL